MTELENKSILTALHEGDRTTYWEFTLLDGSVHIGPIVNYRMFVTGEPMTISIRGGRPDSEIEVPWRAIMTIERLGI